MSDATRANYGTTFGDCQPARRPGRAVANNVSRRSAFAPEAINPGPSKSVKLTCTACGFKVTAIIEYLDPHVIHYAGICPNCYGEENETITR